MEDTSQILYLSARKNRRSHFTVSSFVSMVMKSHPNFEKEKLYNFDLYHYFVCAALAMLSIFKT